MNKSKNYHGTAVTLALVAIASLGVAVMSSTRHMTGDVTNGGDTRTPTPTDLVLTMPAPLNIVDKTTLTLKPKVRNDWSERANDIVIRMMLPPELIFYAEASESGCSVNDQNVVTCPQIMYLSGKQERAVTVRLKVDACKNIHPDSTAKTISVWTIATTSTEDVNTATNIQQDVIDVSCPRIDQGSSSSMRSSNSSTFSEVPMHLECRSNSCVPVYGAGQNRCNSSQDCGYRSSATSSWPSSWMSSSRNTY